MAKKGDFPTLHMRVERGHLVPAFQYDAEALDAYPNGTELNVEVTQARNLKLLRKYWKIITDVVENAPTPWHDKVEASDALKLASGLCDVGKDVDGKWYRRPGSVALTEMDEERFRRYYDLAMATLARVAGMDPEELRKRYKHIPEHQSPAEQGLSQSTALVGDGGISVDTPSSDVASLSTPTPMPGDGATGGAAISSSNPPPAEAVPPATPALREECKSKMLRMAIELKRNPDVTEAEAIRDLSKAAEVWAAEIPGTLAGTVLDICFRVNSGSLKPETAKRYMGGL